MLDINVSNIISSFSLLLIPNKPSQSKIMKTVSLILLILSQIPSVHLADETKNLDPKILFNK